MRPRVRIPSLDSAIRAIDPDKVRARKRREALAMAAAGKRRPTQRERRAGDVFNAPSDHAVAPDAFDLDPPKTHS